MTRGQIFGRVVRGSSLLMCAAIAVAALATTRWHFGWVSRSLKFAVLFHAGAMTIERMGSNADYRTSHQFRGPAGFYAGWNLTECVLEDWRAPAVWPDAQLLPTYSFVDVPLWLPFLLAFGAARRLRRSGRWRYPPGCCASCGYDLTANTSGICPECGTNT